MSKHNIINPQTSMAPVECASAMLKLGYSPGS